ncbi:protein kinase domain-containing protein [Limnoglobus roseus]|uniref:Serine/threonine protein kinase n=1 Tax=Limnoglobus roseus TaxID=2598579 RepID=A0A5C1ARM8_9BACT|nr:serine/threonine-protein kinase [Limnoglobus roseus]QEL20743.1 serine/threonine protein kinase [Limnoglobus roseus]
MRPTTPIQPVAERVRELVRSWRGGQTPDAAAAVADPEVRARPTLVIDLAYEEFCLREAAGEKPDLSRFCARFDSLRSEIRDVLEGHRILTSRPDVLTQAPWPEVGDIWGELRFTRDLGRGAFARVYLVEDVSIGRPVVLKLSRRPSREGLSLGQVSHPHIVDVLWSRTLQGFHAVAMPFEATATLRRVIDAAYEGVARPRRVDRLIQAAGHDEAVPTRPSLLSVRQGYVSGVLRVAGKLAEALAHARSRGISHGDLKPTNVLIAPGGHPLLIDFNLATAAEDVASVVGGTVAYASPERLRAMLRPEVAVGDGEASDVYSFGLILHECLAGSLPFAPAQTDDVREAVQRAYDAREAFRPAPVPGAPRAASDLVRQCLTAAPGGRPTFREVADHLARYGRPQRRFSALAAVGLLMALLAGVTLAVTRPPKDPRTAEEFTARGRSFLAHGKTSAALADFQTAAELHPAGREVATLAFALSLAAQHETAWAKSEEAVKTFALREPWVLNNWAANLVAARHNSPVEMAQAVLLLDEALERDPDSRAIHYNRAMARFWADRNVINRMLPDERCLEDITAVMAGGRVTAALSLDAARLYAAVPGGANAGRAVHYAAEAIRLGTDRTAVIKHPHLKHRLTPADVAFLHSIPQGTAAADVDLRWISPFAS